MPESVLLDFALKEVEIFGNFVEKLFKRGYVNYGPVKMAVAAQKFNLSGQFKGAVGGQFRKRS